MGEQWRGEGKVEGAFRRGKFCYDFIITSLASRNCILVCMLYVEWRHRRTVRTVQKIGKQSYAKHLLFSPSQSAYCEIRHIIVWCFLHLGIDEMHNSAYSMYCTAVHFLMPVIRSKKIRSRYQWCSKAFRSFSKIYTLVKAINKYYKQIFRYKDSFRTFSLFKENGKNNPCVQAKKLCLHCNDICVERFCNLK